MPLVNNSPYKRPWYFINEHMETIIPSLFNKISGVSYTRERLELSDGDFLDLDWDRNENDRLIIISHGAMGNSERHYVRRVAKFFGHQGWDILAWNNRGCSGEPNRLPRLYHHGETEDLSSIVDHSLEKGYAQIVLFGLSMGGCQTVKYFGERKVDPKVLGGFGVSVSFSLRDTTLQAEKRLGGFYGKQFLNELKSQYMAKRENHEVLKNVDIQNIQSFDDLHKKITNTVFGYEDLNEFYFKSSCINYVDGIDRPVLVLNAKNDPFLGPHCFPKEILKSHQYLFGEFPDYGGHVGFTLSGDDYSYIERRAQEFIENNILKLEN